MKRDLFTFPDDVREVRSFFLFGAIGAGAKGFMRGNARVGNMVVKPRCIGSVDVDAAANRDFKQLVGVEATTLDMFSLEQYQAFHGRMPPAGWKEATPEAVPLRAVPWRVRETFLPLENVLDRIEREGTIDAVRGRPVFRELSTGWYELAPAIDGVVDFHRLAAERHHVALDVGPLARLSASLAAGKPLTLAELASARARIETLRTFALRYLSVGDACDLLRTTQIRWELEKETAA